MGPTNNEVDMKQLRPALSEEEMEKAVKQIVFDLGVDEEQARKWAEEAQDELRNKRNAMVTKATVVVAADAAHIDDEGVPAELETKKQESDPWPVTELVKSVVDSVKKQYAKVKK